jgi:hypothetical protein
MTQEDRHEYCLICTNRIFDKSKGILCGLTNKKADFSNKCISFSTNQKEVLVIDIKTKSWQDRKNRRIDDITINKVVRDFRRFYFLLSMFFIVLGLFYTKANGKELDSTSALLYSLAVVFFSISFFVNEKTTYIVIISSFVLFILLLLIIGFLMAYSLDNKTGYNLIYVLVLLTSSIVISTKSFIKRYKLFMNRREEEMKKNEGEESED